MRRHVAAAPGIGTRETLGVPVFGSRALSSAGWWHVLAGAAIELGGSVIILGGLLRQDRRIYARGHRLRLTGLLRRFYRADRHLVGTLVDRWMRSPCAEHTDGRTPIDQRPSD